MHLHSYYRYPSNRDNHIIISITGDIITIVILYKRCKSFDYEIGVSPLSNISPLSVRDLYICLLLSSVLIL